MGIPTLISTATASGASSVDITSGIDSTYDEYMFVFTDIHPSEEINAFAFNISIDGGSNYNVTKTTTTFLARHQEDDAAASLAYYAADDLAQGTGYQDISVKGVDDASDTSCAGVLHLFSPSGTTYVKHFYSTFNSYSENIETHNGFMAGYGNTTSAVNAISFKGTSGTFDGVIQMYGIA